MDYIGEEILNAPGVTPEIAKHIKINCDCGKPLITSENLKHRRCSDYWCREHMAYRGAALMKFLGVKGVGPARCKELMMIHQLKHHMQLIPYVTTEKPKAHLWEIVNLAFIDGLGNKLEDILAGYSSIVDYFAECPNPEPKLVEMRSYLMAVETYFDVIKPLAKAKVNVMITGSLAGFSNRENFVSYINSKYGDKIRVKLNGKAQYNDFLITDNKDAITPKAKTARQCGIPIVNQYEFELIIKALVGEKIE